MAEVRRRRRALVALAYAACGVVVFLTALTATFPYAQTLNRMLNPAGLRLASAAQNWNPPFGARFSDVYVVARHGSGLPPLMQSRRVTVVPALVASLLGSRGVRVTADAYGGVVHLRARETGSSTGLEFDAHALRLDRYPLLNMYGGRVFGLVTATGRADLFAGDFDANTADVHAEITGFAVTVVHGMPAIGFGRIAATARLKDGVLTLAELNNSGGDVALSAEGTVSLAPKITDSELNIRFTIVAQPDAPPHIKLLESILPPTRGREPHVITGTIGAPLLG
ncbi:MAG: type II secretion system protein GspN [Candidatus Binataceae bacterium]